MVPFALMSLVLVSAAPAHAIDFPALLAQLADTYGPFLAGLLGLVIVDVLLGIASALKRRTFDWQLLATFYRETILPKVLGWVAVVVLSYVVSIAGLPPEIGATAAPLVSGLAYLAVALDLLASILSNYREIFAPAAIRPPSAPAAGRPE